MIIFYHPTIEFRGTKRTPSARARSGSHRWWPTIGSTQHSHHIALVTQPRRKPNWYQLSVSRLSLIQASCQFDGHWCKGARGVDKTQSHGLSAYDGCALSQGRQIRYSCPVMGPPCIPGLWGPTHTCPSLGNFQVCQLRTFIFVAHLVSHSFDFRAMFLLHGRRSHKVSLTVFSCRKCPIANKDHCQKPSHRQRPSGADIVVSVRIQTKSKDGYLITKLGVLTSFDNDNDVNLVAPRLVTEVLGMAIQPWQQTLSTPLMNGGTTEVQGYVDLCWSVEGSPSFNENRFLVTRHPDPPFDLILSRKEPSYHSLLRH